MSAVTTDDLRCPQCAAHVAPGAPWCTLCYADLREPARREEVSAPEPTPGPTPGPASLEGAKPRGKHARRPETQPAPATTTDVERAADALLAELAAAESGSPLGRYSSLVDTPAKKVGLMVGGAVAAMCLLFIVMAIVGLLL